MLNSTDTSNRQDELRAIHEARLKQELPADSRVTVFAVRAQGGIAELGKRIDQGGKPFSGLERVYFDVVGELDRRRTVPLYRLHWYPVDETSAEALKSSGAKRFSMTAFFRTGSGKQHHNFEVPVSVSASVSSDTPLSSEWVYCPKCLFTSISSAKGVRSPEFKKFMAEFHDKVRYADLIERSLTNFRFSTTPMDMARYRKNDFRFGVGDKAIELVALGEQNIQKSYADKRKAGPANEAYNKYLERTVFPATIAGKAKRRGCIGGYDEVNPKRGDYDRYLRDVSSFVRCWGGVVRDYDISEYQRRYPEFAANEKRLYSRTSGIVRGKVQSPKAMLREAEKNVERSLANLDWVRGEIARRNENRAERERQRLALRDSFIRTQQSIDAMQRRIGGQQNTNRTGAGTSDPSISMNCSLPEGYVPTPDPNDDPCNSVPEDRVEMDNSDWRGLTDYEEPTYKKPRTTQPVCTKAQRCTMNM